MKGKKRMGLNNFKTSHSILDGSLSFSLQAATSRFHVACLKSKHWKDCISLRISVEKNTSSTKPGIASVHRLLHEDRHDFVNWIGIDCVLR